MKILYQLVSSKVYISHMHRDLVRQTVAGLLVFHLKIGEGLEWKKSWPLLPNWEFWDPWIQIRNPTQLGGDPMPRIFTCSDPPSSGASKVWSHLPYCYSTDKDTGSTRLSLYPVSITRPDGIPSVKSAIRWLGANNIDRTYNQKIFVQKQLSMQNTVITHM